jgi:hypothetical protein
VYQRKGVNISLDISPEISFVGEKNDFMEVIGNLLDNACKYCLEFVEVSARQMTNVHIIIEDDGPGSRYPNVRWSLIVVSAPIRCARARGGIIRRTRNRRTIRRANPDQRKFTRRGKNGGHLRPPAADKRR